MLWEFWPIWALARGLYGSAFVLPLYLAQVEGYNSLQIGEVIMWMGLPQPFLMIATPFLMRHIPMRILVTFGLFLFALSCFLNSFMAFGYAYDQFFWTQIIRAIGQPLVIIPLISLTTAEISKEQAGNASAIFNMSRNLAGSIGIAALGAMIVNHEKLHNALIGESVTKYSNITMERLAAYKSYFIASGLDPVTAQNSALQLMSHLLSREGYIRAFNDAFLLIAILLMISSVLVWGTKPPKKLEGGSGAEGH